MALPGRHTWAAPASRMPAQPQPQPQPQSLSQLPPPSCTPLALRRAMSLLRREVHRRSGGAHIRILIGGCQAFDSRAQRRLSVVECFDLVWWLYTSYVQGRLRGKKVYVQVEAPTGIARRVHSALEEADAAVAACVHAGCGQGPFDTHTVAARLHAALLRVARHHDVCIRTGPHVLSVKCNGEDIPHAAVYQIAREAASRQSVIEVTPVSLGHNPDAWWVCHYLGDVLMGCA